MNPKQQLESILASFNGSKRDWYRTEYLKSHHWKNLRAKALASHGRKCHACAGTGSLDVHHLQYRDIFDVTVADLQVLCRSCHDMEHGASTTKSGKKPRKKKGMSAWETHLKKTGRRPPVFNGKSKRPKGVSKKIWKKWVNCGCPSDWKPVVPSTRKSDDNMNRVRP